VEESFDNLPPLPDALDLGGFDELSRVQAQLPAGCYYLRFSVASASHAELLGTLRVEHAGTSITASGDAYYRLTRLPSIPIARSLGAYEAPLPSAGVPILPRGSYRYYLRMTDVSADAAGGRVRLSFEAWEYGHASKRWVNRGARTAELVQGTAPTGYPAGTRFFEGDVRQGGSTRGRLSIGWISRYLRRARVEVDRVSTAEAPRASGSGVSIQDVFDHVKWQVSLVESSSGVSEPSGAFWSDAELHAAMLSQRERVDLDEEWRYHLLCVRRLTSTSRGIMYDAYGTASNNVPREGAAISSHWVVPSAPSWGSAQGQRFGAATAAYFRTAVHELSHALGLYHPSAGDHGTHIMQTTDVIVANASAATPFPANISWQHSAADQKRLRHFPDHWVRPGGQAFGGDYATAPLSVDAADGALRLEVTPLLASVPLGAPVRVHVRLTNRSDGPLRVPASISLKRGALHGVVRGPARRDKTFRTCVLCVDEEIETCELAPGASLERDETLLRGREGPLFDAPGLHQIAVHLDWHDGDHTLRVSAETAVIVGSPVDEAHANAARDVLACPDLLLLLAFGGDHLADAQGALAKALDNPVLRPHFAFVEARRLSEAFFDREARLGEAEALLDADTVWSQSEKAKLTHLRDAASDRHAVPHDAHRARPVSARESPRSHDDNPSVAL
jgi:hypothetical protein